MTKEDVIKEAAEAVEIITEANMPQHITILHNDKRIAEIGKQLVSPNDTIRSIRNRAIFALVLQMSEIKDKKGYDWELS